VAAGGGAQQSTMPVVGFLSLEPISPESRTFAEFRRGLAESGFFEGQNITFEFRSGHDPQLRELADELLSWHPAVIVAVAGPGPVLALKAATSTVPIAFISGLGPDRLRICCKF
jgi:putative tryptophan/tyrosine transport system substrate-binding protein